MMPSAAIKRNPHEAILEVSALEEDGMTVPDLDQFTNCNICNCALNEDERIINYRFEIVLIKLDSFYFFHSR